MIISCDKRFMNFETSPNNPTFNISTNIPTCAVHVLQFSQTTHKHTQSPTHLGHCFSPLTPIFSRKVHHLSLRRAGASCTKFRHLQQRSVASTHSQRWAVTKILFIVLFAVIRFSRRRRRRLEFTEASMVPSSHAQGVSGSIWKWVMAGTHGGSDENYYLKVKLSLLPIEQSSFFIICTNIVGSYNLTYDKF